MSILSWHLLSHISWRTVFIKHQVHWLWESVVSVGDAIPPDSIRQSNRSVFQTCLIDKFYQVRPFPAWNSTDFQASLSQGFNPVDFDCSFPVIRQLLWAEKLAVRRSLKPKPWQGPPNQNRKNINILYKVCGKITRIYHDIPWFTMLIHVGFFAAVVLHFFGCVCFPVLFFEHLYDPLYASPEELGGWTPYCFHWTDLPYFATTLPLGSGPHLARAWENRKADLGSRDESSAICPSDLPGFGP